MSGLPDYVMELFKGEKSQNISWQSQRNYVVKTIMNKGDERSIGWLMRQMNKQALIKLFPRLKIEKNRINYWNGLLNIKKL
jgi:hypothetical protein